MTSHAAPFRSLAAVAVLGAVRALRARRRAPRCRSRVHPRSISSFRYQEETIFGRFRETRPSQALIVGHDVQQRWGSAEAELEAASFLDDLSQYRLEAEANVSLRLLRGLSLDVGVDASLIRDQIAILKRDATPEEVLLQLCALGTDYRYSAYLGVSYAFGSIFNSVVNPRFGTGPGDILR